MDALSKFISTFDIELPEEGRVLIVGSGLKAAKPDRRKLYNDALGLDMEEGPGVDMVHDLTAPLPAEMLGTFTHAECTSVLEHCNKPWLLANNLEEALCSGGTLLFSVPFAWRFHGYPSDYFRFTAEGVRELFPRIEWKLLVYLGRDFHEKANKALAPMNNGSHPYFARCEVYGFGVKL